MNKPVLLLSLLFFPVNSVWSQLTVQITETTDPFCQGYADGTAAVSVSGGTEPYQVIWDDDSSSTGLTIMGLKAGR
jgi:hypothetical protein